MQRVSLRSLSFPRLLVAVAAVSLAGAQVLHEAGHVLVSLMFGRDPVWGISSLVQLGDRTPLDPAMWTRYVTTGGDESWLHLGSLPSSDAEWIVMLGAGPAIQVIAIVVGLIVAGFARSAWLRGGGLVLALVNGFGMTAYYLLSVARGIGGDEQQVADRLGVEPLVVALPFAAAGLVGLGLAFARLPRPERPRLLLALLIGIVPAGPLVMILNGVVRDQVDAGNGLFLGVLGFSLPVLVVAVAALGFGAWALRGLQTGSASGRPTKPGDGVPPGILT